MRIGFFIPRDLKEMPQCMGVGPTLGRIPEIGVCLLADQGTPLQAGELSHMERQKQWNASTQIYSVVVHTNEFLHIM